MSKSKSCHPVSMFTVSSGSIKNHQTGWLEVKLKKTKNRKGVDRWKKNQRVRWALLNDAWHMMKEKQMIRWERSLAKPRPVRQYVTVISCSRKRGTQGLWFVSLPSCPVWATKNSLSNKSHLIFQALRCNKQGRGTSLALVEMLHLWYTLARRHGKYWTTVEFRQHPVGWKKKREPQRCSQVAICGRQVPRK